MYDTDIICKRIEEAKDIILENRKKYDKLMIIIENFIIENNIIVNNSNISNNNISNKYFFNLFLENIKLAEDLAKLLYKSDPLAKYVTVITKIYNRHSRLIINGIIFAHFTYINKEMKENVISYKCPCNFINKSYTCFGPELQLIDVYTNLYMPIDINKWPELFKKEKELTVLLKNRLNNLLNCKLSNKKITGGKENEEEDGIEYEIGEDPGEDPGDGSEKDSEEDLEEDSEEDKNKDSKRINNNLSITDKIINYFIKKRHVVIGNLATNIYNNKNINKINRIQLITEKNFSYEIQHIKKILPNCTHTISHLHLPTNLNLYKLIIYNDKKPLIDIYNAGSFQVLPYNETPLYKHLQIASLFVIKCFKLIDVWNLLYMSNMKFISDDVAKKIIKSNMDDFFNTSNNIEFLFPKKFIGKYEDLMLKRERLANKLKIKFIMPFMPINE